MDLFRTELVIAAVGGAVLVGCSGDGAMSHKNPDDPTNWNLQREDLGETSSEGGGGDGEKPKEICDTSAYTPMSMGLVEEFGLSVEQWQKVQFYAGGRVLLRRDADETQVEVTEAHSIRRIDDQVVEEVVLECLTPGVLLDVAEASEGRSITVAFDPEAPEAGLAFEASKKGDRFCLALIETPAAHVAYEGKAYQPIETKSCLMIKTEKAEDIRRQQKLLKGIQLE